MVFPFKLRIWDQHEDREGDGWLRFDLVIDLKDITITSFREYILFDLTGNPTRCTQIFLSDGDDVYGCYSIDKFREIYETEYQQVYTDMVVNRMKLDGQIEEEKKPGPLKRIWDWLW